MSGPFRFSVLTVSDRCSRGAATDTSGPALRALLEAQLPGVAAAAACVPDEPDDIVYHLRQWSEGPAAVDLVVTTGGTGLAPRDQTPEATRRVLDREHPGLLELARLRCLSATPRTFLSRGLAGTRGRTLIVNLPGSQRGATETLAAILDILPHALETLRGEVRDDGRPDATSTDAAPGEVIHHTQ